MSLKVSRILHAGYIFESKKSRIIFDPLFESPFSRNCYSFPKVEFDHEQIRTIQFDAVFISHYHDDHCSLESLNYLDRSIPIYMYCLFDELLEMVRELGFEKVIPLTLGKTISIGDFVITPLRALDADVDSIFHIKCSDFNILNVVDSWMDTEMLDELVERGPWGLILWPFQTMREVEVISPSRATPASGEIPEELAEQLRRLNPQALVPSSCQFRFEEWSWYNSAFFPISYRSFEDQMRMIVPQTKIGRMDPSVSLEFEGSEFKYAESLPWIKRFCESQSDYHYEPDLKVPATAEVAKQFPPLTREQTTFVNHFLLQGLTERFQTFENYEESYFFKPRVWLLIVYEGDGAAVNYYYLIRGNDIKIINEKLTVPVAWKTEIIASRLYGALAEGESLTSLYIRINDCRFEQATENELVDTDLLEDPLLRGLYNGRIGSYQQAQLKKIKMSRVQK